MPLVVALHGYGGSSTGVSSYLRMRAVAESRGFVLALPHGTRDRTGLSFWNATDGCCDLYGSDVDDSSYLLAVIHEVQHEYRIDPTRIFVLGHSNGGFMSYRMACDHADTIAAIVSLEGAMFHDASRCAPTDPVSVLEIHGSSDLTIRPDGGRFHGHRYPSTAATISEWAGFDQCAANGTQASAPLDLEDAPGAETSVSTHAGCKQASAVELWTIAGGSHQPAVSSAFANRIIDFLYAHPKATSWSQRVARF